MANRNRLDGKVALITGASSGIGAATAVLFSSLGAKLALVGRNEVNLKKTGEECESNNKEKPFLLVADVTNESEVERIVNETVKKFGKLDILINNAGIGAPGGIEDTSLQQYDQIFNVNVRSVYQLTMLAVPHLIKTKGNIVNVSSITGARAFPGLLAYCMSKSTVDQFTKCVALDLAPKQVRCNGVNPGVIKTEFQKRMGLDEDAYQQFLKRAEKAHPLGRPGESQEVADVIAFLASDQASFITGVNLSVDGGRAASCPTTVT